jgi:hypothetical protein
MKDITNEAENMETLDGNKINFSISDGDSFFAHQASINFNPTMIFLDFKNITPRIDERSASRATLVLKHNVVMLEPYHALVFRDLLNRVIKDYEKEFGKIEKPESIKNLEKKKGSQSKQKEKEDATPSYLG